jgi:hypothetical protein
MENFNTQDLYYIEEFIPFLKKNASFQEIIRGSETVVTSEFKGLGIGEYYLFVFAYNENDELLNEVWDKIVLKEGTNQKNIIFGAPEKISYINLGDGFVDINSFSGIQFDSVESNFNSINVSPSFIDNNITYELYFGTNPSSLVKQLNTKNSTSAGIIIEFKYPEDFTPEYKDLENNTTYYYRIDASNEETKKYNTAVSSNVFVLKTVDGNDYIEKYKNFAYELWKYFYFAQASTTTAISLNYVDLNNSSNSTTGGLGITADEYGRATEAFNSLDSSTEYLTYNNAVLETIEESGRFEAKLNYDTNGNIDTVEIYEDKNQNYNIDYSTEMIEKFYNIVYDTNNHLQSFKYHKYSYNYYDEANQTSSYVDVNRTYDATVTYSGNYFTNLKFDYNSGTAAEINYDFTTTPGVVTVEYIRHSSDPLDGHFKDQEKEVYSEGGK